ncbi:MAG: potassium channel family protein [Candidatus Altiarchaeota archaeon]
MDVTRFLVTYLHHKSLRDLYVALFAVFLVIAVGTLAYTKLMALTPLDALYFTVITLVSVGYGDIYPTTPEAKVFTLFFVLGGISVFIYALGVIITMVFEGRVMEVLKMENVQERMSTLKGHTIICGYGNVGEILASKMENAVVIDMDEEKINKLMEAGVLAVAGLSTRPEILRQAGIDRAKSLVVALNSDPDVLFTILTAKDLNPNIKVFARANRTDSVNNMKRFGADYVVCLPEIVGREFMDVIAKAK